MTDISRRTVLHGVWSAPVVVAAVASPAVAGSQPPPLPPPPCIPGVSYEYVGVQDWNGRTLPQGIQIYNNSGRELTLRGEVTNTPSFVDVGIEDATVVLAHNGGAFSVVVPNGGSVIVRLGVEKDSNNSTGFLRLLNLCDGLGRFQMKTVGKLDRLSTGQ